MPKPLTPETQALEGALGKLLATPDGSSYTRVAKALRHSIDEELDKAKKKDPKNPDHEAAVRRIATGLRVAIGKVDWAHVASKLLDQVLEERGEKRSQSTKKK